MNKCALFNISGGTSGLNQGPVDLQPNALPLSYITNEYGSN